MKLIDYLKSEYNEYVSNSPVAIFISVLLDDIEDGRFEDYPPKNDFEPDYCSPPGDTLKECMSAIGLTSNQLMESLKISEKTLRGVLFGHEPISYSIAIDLEVVFGVPYTFWLNREHQYQLCKARLMKQENKR